MKHLQTILFTTILSLLFLGCKEDKTPCVLANFEDLDEGIMVEKLDTFQRHQGDFNLDNLIYKPRRRFVFAGTVWIKGKQAYSNSYSKTEWLEDLLYKEEPDTVVMDIMQGNPFREIVPNYSQTVLRYTYPDDFNTSTGVVENCKNIWMHPPRSGSFAPMQLSAFPYVKFPLQIGDQYQWELLSGTHYAQKDLINWNGNLQTIMKYEVKEKTNFRFKNENLECYKIEATTLSALGNGKTVFYFNEQYGFVYIKFLSIDNLVEIEINLVDFMEVAT